MFAALSLQGVCIVVAFMRDMRRKLVESVPVLRTFRTKCWSNFHKRLAELLLQVINGVELTSLN